MPFIQQLLLRYPCYTLGVIIVGAFVLFAILGLVVVRHFIPHGKLKSHHDVADPILGALGTIYAVLLAFVVVTVWQGFDRTNQNVLREVNYLADLYRDAEAFSPEFKDKAQAKLREYRQAVVDDEWATMSRGKMSWKAEKLVREIWALYIVYLPRNATEQSFFDLSVQDLQSLRELRRERIMDSKTGMNNLLWFLLIVGALSTLSFTFLFGAENLQAQIVMVGILSVTISLILFAIIEMNYPFTGGIVVSPEPFRLLLLD